MYLTPMDVRQGEGQQENIIDTSGIAAVRASSRGFLFFKNQTGGGGRLLKPSKKTICRKNINHLIDSHRNSQRSLRLVFYLFLTYLGGGRLPCSLFLCPPQLPKYIHIYSFPNDLFLAILLREGHLLPTVHVMLYRATLFNSSPNSLLFCRIG